MGSGVFLLYTCDMPIYEYECRACGHKFEYLLRSNSPAAACPSCAAQDLDQKISLSAMSSDGSRETNLMGAHKRAAAGRTEKQHDEHTNLHKHFED